MPDSETKNPVDVKPVAIIGGGIAGLASAWYLQQENIPYVVFEASDRLGGLVHTITQDKLVMEFGPDAFITRKPHALTLVKELGLEDELVTVNKLPERIYVLVNGKMQPLPKGLTLLVPTDFVAFLQSTLLSWSAKFRMLAEYFIPAKRDSSDESLANFVRRRLGAEALDRLADPLLAGVYNADAEKQSMLATFGQYPKIEKEHGSLIRGMRKLAKLNKEKAKQANKVAIAPLVSLKQGMAQLISSLEAKLSGDIKLQHEVKQVVISDQGYALSFQNGEACEVPGIIFACPVDVSRKLLSGIAPKATKGLQQMRYEGIASMSLLYNINDIPRELDAYGLVIPPSERRSIDGMQWSSSKWQARCPEGQILLRVFYGGPHTRDMLQKAEHEVIEVVKAEVQDILGIVAEPLKVFSHKWSNAYPQYDVGHIELVKSIMDALPDSLALAGHAYAGVGLPDTIKTAKAASAKLVATLKN